MYLPSIIGGPLLVSNISIPGSGNGVVLINSDGTLSTTDHLTWDPSGFVGNLSSSDDTLQKVFNKLDNLTATGISVSDINSLTKLNAIVLDATLVDINHSHVATSIFISDAGNHFFSTNVEGALQEVGGRPVVTRGIRFQLLEDMSGTASFATIYDMDGNILESPALLRDPEMIFTSLVVGDRGIGIEENGKYYIYNASKPDPIY